MSKVYISEEDELLVRKILRKGLLAEEREPKWKALRLALALSFARAEPPSEDYDDYRPRGGEYAWEQLLGKEPEVNYEDSYRAVLSVYHNLDLFDAAHDEFGRLLQRHIRRGLAEIRKGWRETHNFYEFLYQELLSRVQVPDAVETDLSGPLMGALAELGIAAQIAKSTVGPRLQSVDLVLADATQLRTLQKANENLALILGTGPISFSLPGTPRTVTAHIPKPKDAWHTVTWGQIVSQVPDEPDAHLGVCLGMDPLGAAVKFDLTQAPHLLVAGTTNSGKSVTLHAILGSLLVKSGTDKLKLSLIDPKQVEFAVYKGLAHLTDESPITDMAVAKSHLDEIVNDMGEREAKLAELGFKNLQEWRKRRTDAPPYHVVFIEELADLIMQFPEAEVPLVRLAQKGRASGIHLVLATQRPDSVTLSGLLRTNVPSRVALSVQKASESRIILDDSGAELLLGQGDALVKIVGEEVRRVQCAFVDNSDIKSIISGRRS
ncbi:FtsK/SpoIIIE domain-containing protein [Amantichitinum ursilacus]|uniref:DNA translocase FtsK n=1 Tax=Amantichitinum ursilacus TaxID=857265 RepID=A0A0N0XG15_9NEIS|nr:FtsK/SpoIIIE domain-containing protein [Amantichitinum ursilacus]KPC49591.1 DNA translocase FtsK [Amantichitinum ursilacus]